jgi:DNA repair photolyase
VRSQIRGNRPGCECAQSVDIGEYDTCPHGCVYCYAVNRRNIAKRRYQDHDAQSEFLFPSSRVDVLAEAKESQLGLFDLD